MQLAPRMDPDDFEDRNQAKMDEALFVKFFIKSRPDQAATEKENRPMFKDVVYVDIRAPGSQDSVCRPANQADINRFPRHYQAYQNRISTEDVIEGTLLTEWAGISRSMADNLAFYSVKTVEQLALMADNHTMQFMGGGNMKRKAQEWLEATKDSRDKAELQTELKKRDDELDELRAQMAELQAAMKAPKTRARKKKTARKKKVSAKKKE